MGGWEFAYSIIAGIIGGIVDFAIWFYTSLVPFMLKYFGIPLFVLGLLLGLAFTGGTLFFIAIFFIFMYYFIKKIVMTPP
uniref:Uncharacterized protein n=1 Tax=viral metagenome TaxID=1070528 RepID=A0A6C0HLC8_9ZZZZ